MLNINKIKLNTLFCLLLCVSLCFSGGIGSYIVSIPCIVICFFILFLAKKNIIMTTFILAFRKLKEIRWLALFVLFAFVGSIINIFTGHINFFRFLLSITITYFFSIIVYYLIGVIIPLIFPSKKIIKIFITALLIIIFFGLLEFTLYALHVYSFSSVLGFITGRANTHVILKMGLPRIQSFFLEPSIYAWFLSCIIPFSYSMFISKDKIYKNKWINQIICKSLLPLTLISGILTQSPINLIFSLIILVISIFIFSKNIFKLLLKITVITIPIITVFLIFLSRIDLSESYLNRIFATLEVIKNFDALVIVEASLATRIVSYVNMFIIYMHHPIFGTGCGSLTTELYNQLPHSPLPLTWELNQMIIDTKASNANPAILFKLLVDTGSVGIICFSLFLYNIFIKLNNKLISHNQDITSFLLGIKYTMLAFILLSIYNSDIACHFYWTIFGIISGFSLKMLFTKSKQKGKNE